MSITVSDIRTAIPAMSEDFYVLAEYYVEALNGRTNAEAGMLTFVGVMDDLEKGRCGFAQKIDIPKAFIERRDYVKGQLPNLVYLWDKFFPNEAGKFRNGIAEVFKWDVPPLQEAKVSEDELPYVKAAVEWWLNQVQHPSQDNGEPEFAFLSLLLGSSMRARLDERQAKRFVEMLSEGIKKKLENCDEVLLDVDYGPCGLLAKVGDEVDINDFSWPCKTMMKVSAKKVEVSCGYCSPWETLWEA